MLELDTGLFAIDMRVSDLIEASDAGAPTSPGR
jgi:hypothetical protein